MKLAAKITSVDVGPVTDGDCCKQRKSEYFSYRHAGLHVGVSFMKTANPRIVPVWATGSPVRALSD